MCRAHLYGGNVSWKRIELKRWISTLIRWSKDCTATAADAADAAVAIISRSFSQFHSAL